MFLGIYGEGSTRASKRSSNRISFSTSRIKKRLGISRLKSLKVNFDSAVPVIFPLACNASTSQVRVRVIPCSVISPVI